jgi:CubicO group peptidase (beta-lactamase class C family)
VAEVEALPNWRLRVRHNDGVSGIVDMAGLIHSPNAGVFAALRDTALFAQVYLDLGAVTWPGELDLAPDAMHDEIAERGEWILN